MTDKNIRVLIAKPGLDGHELGAVYIAQGLRDAGMEVIYTGLFQPPDQIVRGAIEEDVDVIGLSIHSGAHVTLTKRIMDCLKEENAADQFLVILGGPIPLEDVPKLKEMGVSKVFSSQTKIEDVSQYIEENVS